MKDTEMTSETHIVWQWLRINVPTLIAIGAVLWYIAATDAEQRSFNNQTVDKIDNLERGIRGIDEKVEPLGNTIYRIGVVESQLDDTNARLDRLSENILNSIELVRRDVNGLSTKIEVLSQKVDLMKDGTAARRQAQR